MQWLEDERDHMHDIMESLKSAWVLVLDEDKGWERGFLRI